MSRKLRVDPVTLSAEERRQRGIQPYPATLEEAVVALEQDAVISDALGPELINTFVAVRQAEGEDLSEADAARVAATYFDRY